MVRSVRLVALLLAVLAAQASAQELRLKPISPLASMQLSPALGIPEDSLRLVGRGVYVREVHLGNGETVRPDSDISVHFVGMLTTGQRFTATSDKPYRFRMGTETVIAGWEDGLVGMRVGGRRQLVIPPFLAYGPEAFGRIPADAILVFDITLVDLHQ
jgi:peptidylprolyl isomerase